MGSETTGKYGSAAALALGFALTSLGACGGGGGGGGAPAGTGLMDPQLQAQIAMATQAMPVEGSVHQSSLDNRETAEIDATFPETGPATRYDITIEDPTANDAFLELQLSGNTLNRVGTGLGDAPRDLDLALNVLHESDLTDEVLMATDGEGGFTFFGVDTTGTGTDRDQQHIAWGVWAYVPPNPDSDNTLISVGVFADGGQPYTVDSTNANRLEAKTGPANYDGVAMGLHFRNGFTNLFVGDITLTADFDTESEDGTINGAVENIYIGSDGQDLAPREGLTVALNTATITTGMGGFFNDGMTSANVDGASWTGTWGGQFHGPETTVANDHPASVAGTFGVAAPEANGVRPEALLGAFKADENFLETSISDAIDAILNPPPSGG